MDFLLVRDIMPTMLDLAGVAHPEQMNGRKVRPMQGKSVLGLFEGTATTPYAGADRVGYELFGLKAFFDGDWKILRMPKPFGTGEWELFNVKNDPAELNDPGKQHPDRRKEMIALWEQYKTDNKVLDFSLDMSGGK